jgi:hypothetical protein
LRPNVSAFDRGHVNVDPHSRPPADRCATLAQEIGAADGHHTTGEVRLHSLLRHIASPGIPPHLNRHRDSSDEVHLRFSAEGGKASSQVEALAEESRVVHASDDVHTRAVKCASSCRGCPRSRSAG